MSLMKAPVEICNWRDDLVGIAMMVGIYSSFNERLMEDRRVGVNESTTSSIHDLRGRCFQSENHQKAFFVKFLAI